MRKTRSRAEFDSKKWLEFAHIGNQHVDVVGTTGSPGGACLGNLDLDTFVLLRKQYGAATDREEFATRLYVFLGLHLENDEERWNVDPTLGPWLRIFLEAGCRTTS